MATIDVAVRAASTCNRTRPVLQDMGWNRMVVDSCLMPDYLEAAIHDECSESLTDRRWARQTGVAVIVRVVEP